MYPSLSSYQSSYCISPTSSVQLDRRQDRTAGIFQIDQAIPLLPVVGEISAASYSNTCHFRPYRKTRKTAPTLEQTHA